MLGYKTFKKDIAAFSSIPDTIFLSPFTLKEVEVRANREMHEVDKDSYFVTDSMRKGTTFAADMLGLIKGITYNWYDGSLSVYGQKNILLLVNGVEKSDSYIKNINPKRITKVEVIHNPSGRYISDNYAAIINLVLYEDYVGWDLNLGDKSLVKLNQLDNSNWLFIENPNTDFTYTKNKITVNANYSYERKKFSSFDRSWESYPGIIEKATIAIDDSEPNLQIIRYAHYFSGGIDYQLSKQHSLSFQGKYSYNGENLNYTSLLWSKKAGLEEEDVMQWVHRKGSSNDWVGTLFYRGKIGDHLEVYSDFNYNYYGSNSNRDFVQEDWFSGNYKSYNRKDYIRFNTDATYTFNNDATLKLGYSTTWKEYTSKNLITGVRESKSDNYRDRIFSYFSYKLNQTWSTSIGGGMEWIRYKNSNTDANHLALMPDIKVMYKPNKSVDAVLQYNTSIEYPTLDQTTSYRYKSDSLMYSMGNPYLKQTLYQNASLRLRLWNCLTIIPSVSYADNLITGFYRWMDDGYVLNSFVNADLRKYSLDINYQTMFWKHFIFSINATFGRDEIRYGDIKNAYNVWKGESSLMYMDRKTGWRVMLNYLRGTNKNIQIQGTTRGGDGYWMMALMKTCCKDRLSLMAAYILPYSWFIEKNQKGETNTAFYQRISQTNNFELIANNIMLRINYRLDYGKRTKKHDNKATVDHE